MLSLSYAAAKSKPAIHVGFLNFQPFPDFPEFHAIYKLKNTTERMMKELTTENVRLTTELAKQNTLFAKTLAEKDSALAEKDALTTKLMAQLGEVKN